MRNIHGIIFDFDGLILDTETPQYIAWKEIYQQHGVNLQEQSWVDVIGRPPETQDFCTLLEEELGKPVDRDDIRAKRKPRLKALLDAESIRPGIEQYLIDAAEMGLRIGLASSSDHDWVESNLHRLELHDYFHIIICNEDTSRHKPDPSPYLHTARKLGVKAEQAIALEDSPHGIASARAAGCFTVAVPNSLTVHLDLSLAHLQVESLGDLTLAQLIEQVE